MKKFNWKITGKKFLYSFIEVLCIGFIAYATDKPSLLVLIPVAEALKNIIKNKDKL